MKAWALLISGAVSPYLFDATLPDALVFILVFLLAPLALNRSFRFALLFPAFFFLTTLAINQRLEQRLPETHNKSVQIVSGVIDSLPLHRSDYLQFIFLPDSKSSDVPVRLKVSWHISKVSDGEVDLPAVHAGERWQLHLQLRTTRGRVNFHGVDPERWLFAEGIAARAYVQAGQNILLSAPGLLNLQHWRESVLEKLETSAADVPAFRILTALAIADRRAMLNRDRDIFGATGTGHLLAISGLHIGLAAVMGFYLGRFLLLFFPYVAGLRASIALPWTGAWLMALCYAALSGFGVSTQRALIMLSVATVVFLCRRRIHPALAWMIAMSLVLLRDPLAPLRAGFWFSFVAVAVLLLLFAPRYGPMPAWRRVIYAQFGISLVMAPLGMYWFQQASLPGLFANLVAIPVVSLVVVPLILIGLLLLWLPGTLATWALWLAGYTTQALYWYLEQLAALQPIVLSATRTPSLASTLLAMLGALLILLPKGLPGRLAGVLLMLPMLVPVANPLGPFETRVDMLDVGQGLAVLVGNRDYLLVYDTGPGNGRSGEAAWHFVDSTVAPMVAAHGQIPDLVIASHADLDHAGGLERLREIYPNSEFMANLPVPVKAIGACIAPARWTSGDLSFNVLHPI